jgi:hypothetical protein
MQGIVHEINNDIMSMAMEEQKNVEFMQTTVSLMAP